MSDAPASSPSDHPIVRARYVVLALLVAICAWMIPGIGLLRHDDDVLAVLTSAGSREPRRVRAQIAAGTARWRGRPM